MSKEDIREHMEVAHSDSPFFRLEETYALLQKEKEIEDVLNTKLIRSSNVETPNFVENPESFFEINKTYEYAGDTLNEVMKNLIGSFEISSNLNWDDNLISEDDFIKNQMAAQTLLTSLYETVATTLIKKRKSELTNIEKGLVLAYGSFMNNYIMFSNKNPEFSPSELTFVSLNFAYQNINDELSETKLSEEKEICAKALTILTYFSENKTKYIEDAIASGMSKEVFNC